MKGISVQSNRTRDYFVTRKEADAVLAACPDAQWQLIFALSRYGGLRCPSEHLALRWGDVDWEHGKMTIRASKTEHYEGRATRVIPLFPELRPYLEAVRQDIESDAEFDPKVTPLSKLPVITRYRDTNANLRTQLMQDHPPGPAKAVAQAVPEFAGHKGNGVGRRIPDARSGRLARAQHHDRR